MARPGRDDDCTAPPASRRSGAKLRGGPASPALAGARSSEREGGREGEREQANSDDTRHSKDETPEACM
jgi:hypothetical protein